MSARGVQPNKWGMNSRILADFQACWSRSPLSSRKRTCKRRTQYQHVVGGVRGLPRCEAGSSEPFGASRLPRRGPGWESRLGGFPPFHGPDRPHHRPSAGMGGCGRVGPPGAARRPSAGRRARKACAAPAAHRPVGRPRRRAMAGGAGRMIRQSSTRISSVITGPGQRPHPRTRSRL